MQPLIFCFLCAFSLIINNNAQDPISHFSILMSGIVLCDWFMWQEYIGYLPDGNLMGKYKPLFGVLYSPARRGNNFYYVILMLYNFSIFYFKKWKYEKQNSLCYI